MNETSNNLPNKFEAELHRMAPAALPPQLISRIGHAIDHDAPSPWAQRRLLGAIWAGSLAACVILTMLLMQNESSVTPNAQMNISSNLTSADGPSLAVALADPKWIDSVK
jgi:hypothetical protein